MKLQGLEEEPMRAQPLALNLTPAVEAVPRRGSGRLRSGTLRRNSFGAVAKPRPKHTVQELAAQRWLDSLAVCAAVVPPPPSRRRGGAAMQCRS